MASVLGKYEGPAQIFVGTKLLANATSCRFTVTANDSPVRTMNGGRAALAGFSGGAVTTEVQISSAIPVAGYEYDAYAALQARKTVRIVLKEAGKRRQVDARIQTVSSERSVDGPASVDFTAMGGEPLAT